jgi:competence protein ComEA
MRIDRNYLIYLIAGIFMGVAGATLYFRLRNQVLPAPIIIVPPEPTATLAPTATPGPVNVFISGEVTAPGLYQLAPGSLVADAIHQAGAFTRRAAQEQVNLALTVSEGMQIHVPAVGETAVVVPPISTPPAAAPPVAGESSSGSTGGLININTASQGELTQLPGIGPSTAAAIITFREQNGAFATIEAITNVPGIGNARLEQIRHLITVGE